MCVGEALRVTRLAGGVNMEASADLCMNHRDAAPASISNPFLGPCL
jgi:hypothetical protein